MKQLRRPEVLADLRAVIEYLGTRSDTTSRTGIIGFSLGGYIAYLAATQFYLPAAAAFYGGWITNTDILLKPA